MKPNIKRILAFILVLAVFPVILLLGELKLPEIYAESYYAELPEMYERLYSAEGKKLVIIGSSNVAFGVDTRMLGELMSEHGYEYTVCPFGLYAAVGTSAMLDLAADALSEGDIVVLSFEPSSEAMSSYFGATAFLKCAESMPQLITKLDKSRVSQVIGNYIPYLQERYSIVSSGSFPKAEGVYARSSFDESCNMTYPREGNTMRLGYDSSSPIDLASLTVEPEFSEQVAKFCEAASRRGATVYYSFCPMNRSALVDESPEAVEALFNLCRSNFPAVLISDPNRYILDSGWFYDSNFHLNTAGSKLRTLRLAEDVLAQLGCCEPVEAELPSMPASIAAKPTASIQSGDTRCFVFEISDNSDAYLVSGLSSEGLLASGLTIPSGYEGLPVVGFTSGALNNCTELEELRIPDTVESIPDSLFADCSKLSRVILEHTESPCKISEHSLDGADNIRFYVPLEAYSMYRDGYGCERNLWSDYIGRIYTY